MANEYLNMTELIKDYYDKPVGEYLNRTVTINNVELACDIYRVAPETVLTSAVFTGCTAVDANTQIVIGRDMSVANGTTLIPPYRCKGIIIGDVGTFTNEGTISMTARGASGAGKNIQLTADYMISAVGGAGGVGANNYSSGTNFSNGKNGDSPTASVLSCGGGGSGGAGHNSAAAGHSGVGGTGTSFSGGAGSGGAIGTTSSAGSSSGGAGSNGLGGGSNGYNATGGAGNPSGTSTGSRVGTGGNGTGGLIIILANNLVQSGSLIANGIQAAGMATTTGYITDVTGGSSGGGCIVLISKTRTITGTNSVAGGIAPTGGDGNGGAGGAGAYASYIVEDLILQNLPVEFAITDKAHLDNIEPSEAVRFIGLTDDDELYYDIMGKRHNSGSGHIVEDEEGTSLTKRKVLTINSPLTVEDDSTNEKTVIGADTDAQIDWTQFNRPSTETEPSPIIPFKYIYARWLRFDPTNQKGLVIKGGTSILLANGKYKQYVADTQFDLTDDITTNGIDYYVFMDNNGDMHASTNTSMTDCVLLGRFHTLCVAAGTMTMIAPASPSSGLAVGGKYLVKSYRLADDPDFYNFYNKNITAVSVNTKYDVITMTHPLSGFVAGAILPESVWCSTFKPDTRFDDAMVFDKDTNIAVDIYLQSGTGLNTRSKYNATHTVSREPYNHMGDMLSVGKRLLRDNEFTSIALGSNEATNIYGSANATTVGGHKDTNNRRMISAIGVEEACGYLWTWLQEVSSPGTGTADNWDTDIAVSDGQGSFGREYWTPYVAVAGGTWATAARAGSRARTFAYRRSDVSAHIGGRGSSQVIYGIR